MNRPHRGRLRVYCGFCLTAMAAMAAAAEQPQGTLLLVRQWDRESGTLVGWLPNHEAAMVLDCLDPESLRPKLALDEAVQVEWLRRGDSTEKALSVNQGTREFDGKRWVPVLHDANIVRIGRHHFLIRELVLGRAKSIVNRKEKP